MEERSVFDPETQIALAVEAGLDEVEVSGILADSEAYAADVHADEREAAELGGSGVPFFVTRPALRHLRRPGPTDIHQGLGAGMAALNGHLPVRHVLGRGRHRRAGRDQRQTRANEFCVLPHRRAAARSSPS